MSAPAATATPPAPQPVRRGIVKQVLSGDTVIIRGAPKGGPPPEKQITFSSVTAPKLARRPANPDSDETKDEPYAWEAREFLRKKLIGEEVVFTVTRPPNATRDYGTVYLGKNVETGENMTEAIVSAGLVTVRRDGPRTPELQRLIELEDAAKSAGRGKWSSTPSSEHIRSIKWTQENPRHFIDQYNGRPVPAIIEHVRDGSTIRAFLLPDFNYITLMISGIRCPGVKLDADGKPDPSVKVPYADEARYFVESRLLQRDVEIRLESVNNSNFVGSILFPLGNIAEALLREGLAKCVDWSMAFMKTGADKLRAAERQAKEKRLRLWKDYQSNAQTFSGKEKDFTGTVIEVYNGDAISVKTANGATKKVFLSSIRPPREPGKPAGEDGKQPPRPKNFRPLYDIPWMYEAREFLRKKLINKKVQCSLDYISPARDNFPEKYCYTVTIGGTNVAEAIVSKGLATVIRYRQDDDQRSSRYDDLLAAETQAIKGSKGVHAKKDIPSHRINDLTVDHSRIKHQYLPSWQRALRTEGIVEFVASGSRIRLYVPKDSCLVTFLLAGISCPRSARPAANGIPAQEGEPFGDDALAFTKDRILQRDVSVHIETTDKAGTCVIGWLWTENNINLSVALVEEGLAEVHFSAEKSEHYRALKAAEDKAKAARKNIWANYVEPTEDKVEEEKEEKVSERVVKYETVVVTEVTPELHFFAQHTDQGAKLENLMSKLRQEFQSNPPITGAYTPKRGDMCAAKFTEDKEWYRAKVEKIQGGNASICYVDYGNKEVNFPAKGLHMNDKRSKRSVLQATIYFCCPATGFGSRRSEVCGQQGRDMHRETVPFSNLASLPGSFVGDKPYALEYVLALANLPPDNEDKQIAVRAFAQDVLNRNLNLNVEYKLNNVSYASLHDPSTNADVAKSLIGDGLLLVDKRRERKLQSMVSEYKEAEAQARKSRLGIWEYGDITEDDATEFGR